MSADVTLYYQSTSKEFVEFLRDENSTDSKGQELYDLWNNNGKAPPEQMATVQLAIVAPVPGDGDHDGDVDLADYAMFVPCLTGPVVSANGSCLVFDLDGDEYVDVSDFGGMQNLIAH